MVWPLRKRAVESSPRPTAHLKRQLTDVKQTLKKTVDRLLDTSNDAVVRACEDKISDLGKAKVLIEDQISNGTASRGQFDQHLEPALQFLASPWKLWGTRQIEMRRLVLKLSFAERIVYCRNEGARTPELSFPFKTLGSDCICHEGSGGA